MKSALACLALMTPLAAPLAAQDPIPPVVQDLVAAERAFARASVEKGSRDAFLAVLSEKGVVFRPRPVFGRQWYGEREDPGGQLDWRPAFAQVSAAGDLGWTTGPWSFTPEGESEPSLFGHYVSIWGREPDGSWSLRVDVGVVHGSEANLDETALEGYAAPDSPTHGYPETTVAREQLFRLDAAYSDAARREGYVTALSHVAAPDVRLYRQEHVPGIGLENAEAAIAESAELLSWDVMSGAASHSYDLGYTYGIALTRQPEGGTGTASYLRIWTRELGDEWKLQLELTNPIE